MISLYPILSGRFSILNRVFVERMLAHHSKLNSKSRVTGIPSSELRDPTSAEGQRNYRLINEPRGHRRATDANENGCHDEPGKGHRATVLADIIITGMFELALTFADTFPRAFSLAHSRRRAARAAPRRAAPFS